MQVTYEGATPEVVESVLIMPIEERLLGIEGRQAIAIGSAGRTR